MNCQAKLYNKMYTGIMAGIIMCALMGFPLELAVIQQQCKRWEVISTIKSIAMPNTVDRLSSQVMRERWESDHEILRVFLYSS